jgi:hypothetical protein
MHAGYGKVFGYYYRAGGVVDALRTDHEILGLQRTTNLAVKRSNREINI